MKVEADKTLIVSNPPPTLRVIGTTTSPMSPPNIPYTHYTPIRNIDSNAPSNRLEETDASHTLEDVRISLMESIARALRSAFPIPERLIVGSMEYVITKSFRDDYDGYISITAWFGATRVLNLRIRSTPFVNNRNEAVQRSLMRVIDGTLCSPIGIPSTITVDGTTYRINCSYSPASVDPPREGWLCLTVDAHYTPVASVNLVVNNTAAF